MAIFMAMSRRPDRNRTYSIAEARDRLAAIVHGVEVGEPAVLTRRGKPVAVLVSSEDFERLSGSKQDFGAAIQEWRREFAEEIETLDLASAFEDLRDPSPGRKFRW